MDMKPDDKGSKEQKPLWQRMAWLVGLWGASVLALGTLAYVIRLFMSAAGLTT
ncbi:DUF2474 domain-containing protein [Stutzerimonas nosocomialis]|uniref:DUF2474 domain-containing protein n=2 Tax=Stutzerimonas nosocomialis TaxID=1056496 RepID=A0A5R9QIV7_9GAMM|nr:DUF2474 domain-containing protein [Stutzerimonas nosocomialis]TLX57130.1 DUF2474 domain-containing protein [Stutzerimonas nosocomialis]TLX65246.1 DUF2474 domain-containing protein [Stutzerimonas nosocomialis]